MINIAVCDDNVQHISKLTNLISSFALKHAIDVKIFPFTSGSLLLQSTVVFSIVFLDIELGDENGLDIAKTLRKENKEFFLIFVSNYVQYAPFGYNVKAMAYLLKDNLNHSFDSAFHEVLHQIDKQDHELFFSIGHKKIRILIDQIIYIESQNKNVIIYLKNNVEYSVRITLKEILEKLSCFNFVRIHKCYIVNLKYVTEIKNYSAILTNSQKLQVGLKHWSNLLTEFIAYKGASPK